MCIRDRVLPELGNQTMFSYWRSRLTDTFIQDIKQAGGILCNLASDEMKSLFDWKRVEKEVHVVTPEFHVWKNGKLATVVIYTKMSRGEICLLYTSSGILHTPVGSGEVEQSIGLCYHYKLFSDLSLIHIFVYLPTTSPCGYSSFPKEESSDTIDFQLSSILGYCGFLVALFCCSPFGSTLNAAGGQGYFLVFL